MKQCCYSLKLIKLSISLSCLQYLSNHLLHKQLLPIIVGILLQTPPIRLIKMLYHGMKTKPHVVSYTLMLNLEQFQSGTWDVWADYRIVPAKPKRLAALTTQCIVCIGLLDSHWVESTPKLHYVTHAIKYLLFRVVWQ